MLRVGVRVLAKHPFSGEREEGIIMDVRERAPDCDRGPFYLVRFDRSDDKNFHTAYTNNPIIRRWERKQDIEIIE